MDVKTEKVVTLKLNEGEVGQLHDELKSVKFVDTDHPLMYKIWVVVGGAV